MVQRVVISSLAGAQLSISAALPATYDAAGYGSTAITWTAVGKTENLGSHGVTVDVAEFTPVNTGVTEKVKTIKKYGEITFSLAHLPSDAGQTILHTASESYSRYSAKIVYQDTSIHYFDVLISKFEYVDGAAGDIQKVNVAMPICRAPVIVAQV